MKHLIVVAHPNVGSLTMELARRYTEQVQSLGHSPQLVDLYRVGFNPVLTAGELTDDAPARANPELVTAQEDLRAVAVLTVIYPLWWLSMPAILKGYIDRVFARGFAYESREGTVHGLLKGKRCVLITLSGAPLSTFAADGRWNAVQSLQDTHIFRSAGFELLEHLHIAEVHPDLSRQTVEGHVERVEDCARRHFGTPR